MTNETNAEENLVRDDVALSMVDENAGEGNTPLHTFAEGEEVVYIQTEDEIGGLEGTSTDDVTIH